LRWRTRRRRRTWRLRGKICFNLEFPAIPTPNYLSEKKPSARLFPGRRDAVSEWRRRSIHSMKALRLLSQRQFHALQIACVGQGLFKLNERFAEFENEKIQLAVLVGENQQQGAMIGFD
jgi:hypothetical protein